MNALVGVIGVGVAALLAMPAIVPAIATATAADTTVARPASSLEAARIVTASIQEKFGLPKSNLYRHKLGKDDVEFMWGNGVMFSALVAAARHDPQTYGPQVSKFFDAMNRYWDTKAPVPGYEPAPTKGGGNDKYYDDNAWMVITFIEAYEQTGDKKYLRRAEETMKFVLSGWDDKLGGGVYWHEQKRGGKNTCSNAPTAVAAVYLARHTDRSTYIDWAERITAWTQANLQDKDALYFDSKKIPSEQLDKGKLTYNTALMLRANLGLHRITKDAKYLEEAKRIGANCDWFLSDKTGAYRDPPKWAHLQVEADLELHRATGDEAALSRARKNGEVMFAQWQEKPSIELIEQAGIARTLWLLAEHETPAGQQFWRKSDARDSVSAR